MSWTLSTSGACIRRAGTNANTTIVASGAALLNWSDQAEGELNTATRKDWVTDYADVGTNFKPILDKAVSCLVAMDIVNYDPSGYTNLAEAQTILDVLRDNYIRAVELLKDEKNKEKM